jgi:hypothetical protein
MNWNNWDDDTETFRSSTFIFLGDPSHSRVLIVCRSVHFCHTNKKNFLIYKKIQKRSVAKSYMTNGPSSYVEKYLRISEISYT